MAAKAWKRLWVAMPCACHHVHLRRLVWLINRPSREQQPKMQKYEAHSGRWYGHGTANSMQLQWKFSLC